MSGELRRFVIDSMASKAAEVLAINAYLLVAHERESVFGDGKIEEMELHSEQLQEELGVMERGVRVFFGIHVGQDIIDEAARLSGGIP